jgi:hypothetical protein
MERAGDEMDVVGRTLRRNAPFGRLVVPPV